EKTSSILIDISLPVFRKPRTSRTALQINLDAIAGRANKEKSLRERFGRRTLNFDESVVLSENGANRKTRCCRSWNFLPAARIPIQFLFGRPGVLIEYDLLLLPNRSVTYDPTVSVIKRDVDIAAVVAQVREVASPHFFFYVTG